MEPEKQPLTITGLDSYYQIEFQKIYDSNETYKGKWNWWAFLFTWIWCLTKGCWGYALLIIAPVLMTTVNENIVALLTLGYLIISGWRGTWIYYNVKIKNKQFPSL